MIKPNQVYSTPPEHEACIMDVNELHWHVNFAKRNQTKAKSRFQLAERLNSQLKEDINFVKQHVWVDHVTETR